MPALTLILFCALFLSIGIALLGRRKPGYRHLHHTISELGETGAPDQKLAAYALFLPVGLILLALAGWHWPQPSAKLALCLACGYLGAVAFPCDPGSPLAGSWRQSLHNLAGGVQYLGSAWLMLGLAEGGTLLRAAVYVLLLLTAALSLLPPARWRGLVQRGAESLLFAVLFWTCVQAR